MTGREPIKTYPHVGPPASSHWSPKIYDRLDPRTPERTMRSQFCLYCIRFYSTLQELQCAIEADNEIEKLDPAGLTPLQLCAIVGNTEAAEVTYFLNSDPFLSYLISWGIEQIQLFLTVFCIPDITRERSEPRLGNEWWVVDSPGMCGLWKSLFSTGLKSHSDFNIW